MLQLDAIIAAWLTTATLTKSDFLRVPRKYVDRAYQWFHQAVWGSASFFSPASCALCCGFWVALGLSYLTEASFWVLWGSATLFSKLPSHD